jgi:orotate phosphoribosyltransferase
MNQKFLQALAKHVKKYPEFFLIGPLTASNGVLVPVYPEIRTIYSNLPVLRVVVEEMAGLVKKIKGIEIIAGTEAAGIPLAVALSLKLNLPFVAVRKERKKFLNLEYVDGRFKKGQRAVLIDDAMGWGNTKKLMIKNARRAGLIIKDVVCVYDSYIHEPEKRKWFFKNKIKIYSLATRQEIFCYLSRQKAISREINEINEAYTLNPAGWQKNFSAWQKFLAWKKRYSKTEII